MEKIEFKDLGSQRYPVNLCKKLERNHLVFAFLIAARVADPIVSLATYQFARDTLFFFCACGSLRRAPTFDLRQSCVLRGLQGGLHLTNPSDANAPSRDERSSSNARSLPRR